MQFLIQKEISLSLLFVVKKKGSLLPPLTYHSPLSPEQAYSPYSLSHTPEVHLNPDPNATCMTRCPFRSGLVFCCSWMYSSSYQIEEDEVLP